MIELRELTPENHNEVRKLGVRSRQAHTVCSMFVCLVGIAGCSSASPFVQPEQIQGVSTDRSTLAGEKHLVRDYSPLDPSGNINVVIEIPTGSNEKWEVDKTTGELRWEVRNGNSRIVEYLGYPGNYGMIPATLLPKSMGGDGDPLDVLVLGPALARGSIVSARAIGVLSLLDGGEQDDKIIAVMSDSVWGSVTSMEELKREFAGVGNIIEIWFSNYKGPGKMESKGFSEVAHAQKIIRAAIDAYKVQNRIIE